MLTGNILSTVPPQALITTNLLHSSLTYPPSTSALSYLPKLHYCNVLALRPHSLATPTFLFLTNLPFRRELWDPPIWIIFPIFFHRFLSQVIVFGFSCIWNQVLSLFGKCCPSNLLLSLWFLNFVSWSLSFSLYCFVRVSVARYLRFCCQLAS